MAEKKVSASEGGKDDSKPVTAKKTSRATSGKDVAGGEVKSNVSTTVTDVTTSDLKNRFAAGSIPLSTDFGNLIDIAECGRRAVGQSPDQTNNTIGAGLSIASDTDPANMGKLSVNLNSSSGLEIKDGAVAVKAGNGIYFDSGAVTVEVHTGYGLDVDSGGVFINRGNGLYFDSDNGALTVKVKSAGGITVSSDGISIDPAHVLPKGMIMMFSNPDGKGIPTGWVLCDGTNGTPNLLNRFIVGGAASDIGGASTSTLTGDKSNKNFTAVTDSGTLNLSGKTKDVALTLNQMPAHDHNVLSKGGNTNADPIYVVNWDNFKEDGGGNYYMPMQGAHSGDYASQLSTEKVGGSQSHAHDLVFNTGTQNHTHNVPITVPYYILAFIMKT
ncbi:hypothetical protein PQQ51_11395 [Paraburkholderia xenovorans]|uniref:hypothetical protein n=1 Tax=Paraburkholderia xenovorans TaxID=36873 RepID=UPI0038BA1227